MNKVSITLTAICKICFVLKLKKLSSNAWDKK